MTKWCIMIVQGHSRLSKLEQYNSSYMIAC